MAKDKRGSVITEWDQDKERYRLIARGKWTEGYEDKYIIERLGADGIGEPRWGTVYEFGPNKNERPSLETLLVGAIKSVRRPST